MRQNRFQTKNSNQTKEYFCSGYVNSNSDNIEDLQCLPVDNSNSDFLVSSRHNSPKNPQMIYVNSKNKSLTQTGTTWATAFSDLQHALDLASTLPASEIWISKGVYIPTKIYSPNGITGGAYGHAFPSQATNSGLLTFNIPNNTSIFGGFHGNESRLADRDPHRNETVLSGGKISWHVVTLGNDIAKTGVTAKLNGLTIANGYALGPTPSTFPIFGPLTYAHSFGGGIYSTFGSNLTLEKVLVTENSAGNTNTGASGYGGGLLSNNSTLTIKECKFTFNTSTIEGGGLEVLNTFETTPHIASISDSIFENNNATLFGSAITTEGSQGNIGSYVQVNKCTFRNNSAQYGGSFAMDSLQTNLSDCKFENNYADVAGGALSTANIVNTISYGAISKTPSVIFTTEIKGCIFKNNLASGNQILHDLQLGGTAAGLDFGLGGGAIVVYMNGRANISDTEFIGNMATNGDGGAILNGRAAAVDPLGIPVIAVNVNTSIINCNFVDNKIKNGFGGAIASLPSTYPFPNLPRLNLNETILTVKNSNFEFNKSIKGGAIYTYFTTLTEDDNNFKKNEGKLGESLYSLESTTNGDFHPLKVSSN